MGDEGLLRVNWLKLAALHLARGAPPPSPTMAWVWPEGRVLERPGAEKPGTCWSKWLPGFKALSLAKRLWMSWNFSFSSCKKTSTRSFFSRLSCSTMFLGTSGITQATTRLRNITKFWRREKSGEMMDLKMYQGRFMRKVTSGGTHWMFQVCSEFMEVKWIQNRFCM